MNLEEQYDRIYKYLYFRLHDQHTAEDLTPDTGNLPSVYWKQDVSGREPTATVPVYDCTQSVQSVLQR